jgi:hypothetical protein
MRLAASYIEAYAAVYPRLSQHSATYPDPGQVRAGLKRGAVEVPFVLDQKTGRESGPNPLLGPGRDTEGSEYIIRLIDRSDARCLNIAVWGGTADLGQALWRLRETRSAHGLAQALAKLRVHAISDQDSTSPWIRAHFPELFYIHNHARDDDKWHSCYRGMFVGGDESRGPFCLEASAGQHLKLSAEGSFDPDGDALSFRWWCYQEAGSYAEPVKLGNDGNIETELIVPTDAAGSEIHIILEATDAGSPNLTAYARAIVRVR